MSRSRRLAYYALPMAFCLAVHWLALRTWFFFDDFVWLQLRLKLNSPADLLPVLFTPQAQGTIRVIDRLYYLVLSSAFGLHAPPFRVVVFLVEFVNIALLIQITRRITGSAAAGFLAPILWTGNCVLAMAMCWSGAFTQLECAFFVLLAFRLFLLYIDTGRRRFWIWQWVVFILGFGALELTVMYPVIAAAYAFWFARPHFRKALLLFIPSAIFSAMHYLFVPHTADASYELVPSAMPVMFWKYWNYVLGSAWTQDTDWRPNWLGLALTIAITAALLLFVARSALKRDWIPAFGLLWFVAFLAPVVPLRNHFIQYYASLATIGLAITAAYALARSSGFLRPLAIGLAAVYLAAAATEIYLVDSFYYRHSRPMKHLIAALQESPAVRSSKTILLDGVDTDLFWIGFDDDPFRLIGIRKLYLLPGSEKAIDPQGQPDHVAPFIISVDQAMLLLARGEAAVLQLHDGHIQDLTKSYLQTQTPGFLAGPPHLISVGAPLYSSLLYGAWYNPERRARWMSKNASIKIGGPTTSGQILEITGFCPALLLEKGPLAVSLRVDGNVIGAGQVNTPNQFFDLKFPLPAALIGRQSMQVDIDLERTTQVPGDLRQLGLIIDTVAIR